MYISQNAGRFGVLQGEVSIREAVIGTDTPPRRVSALPARGDSVERFSSAKSIPIVSFSCGRSQWA